MPKQVDRHYEHRYRVHVTGPGLEANITLGMHRQNTLMHLTWANAYRAVGTGRAFTRWKIYDVETGRKAEGTFPCQKQKFGPVLSWLSSPQLSLWSDILPTKLSTKLSATQKGKTLCVCSDIASVGSDDISLSSLSSA